MPRSKRAAHRLPTRSGAKHWGPNAGNMLPRQPTARICRLACCNVKNMEGRGAWSWGKVEIKGSQWAEKRGGGTPKQPNLAEKLLSGVAAAVENLLHAVVERCALEHNEINQAAGQKRISDIWCQL